MNIRFKKLKDGWMKDPAFRAEYDKLKPEFETALAVVKSRRRRARCNPPITKR